MWGRWESDTSEPCMLSMLPSSCVPGSLWIPDPYLSTRVFYWSARPLDGTLPAAPHQTCPPSSITVSSIYHTVATAARHISPTKCCIPNIKGQLFKACFWVWLFQWSPDRRHNYSFVLPSQGQSTFSLIPYSHPGELHEKLRPLVPNVIKYPSVGGKQVFITHTCLACNLTGWANQYVIL